MDAEAQIESFIAKFSDETAAQIRAARAEMRRRLPGAIELVYDNYNALAIGYASGERVREVVFSLACFPRWVSLYFFHGARLEDPERLLKGAGSQGRHIRLTDLALLDAPGVRALMDQSLALAEPPIDPAQPSRSIVKSISAKQRPRRP